MGLPNGVKPEEKCADMMASRGMGSIQKSKMPKGVKKLHYASGGAVTPAALIDGNEFLLAAQRYGLGTDKESLNKIVNLVNQGETVESAAKKLGGKK